MAGQPDVPVEQLPEAALKYVRKYRDVKYHEALFEALARQYEAARLDEANAGSPLQIIDKAVTPEKKSWPPRIWIVLAGTVFGAMAASFWVLMRHTFAGRM